MTLTELPSLLTETDRIEIRLAALNDCAPEVARAQFKRCCSSSHWIHLMEQARPFAGIAELEAWADRAWVSCSQDDWLEAFAAHPRIGETSGNRWSRQDQASVALAAAEVLDALAKANRAYEAKFGYTFIVCATGKSAAEMLDLLEQRLHNPVEMEIKNAAEHQHLILRLRLRKLLSE